jgi:hypothetical protein
MGIIYSIDRVGAPGVVTMDLRINARGNNQILDIRYWVKCMTMSMMGSLF